ncbi:MAG: tryptophan synthase subunit alpha [Proteobacteria bacterium]|nr:tryptophan synthase subunit alpha [Pseudomonadota bacterium]
MTRISDTFKKLKAKGEKALIAYITAGDPDMQTTEDFLHCLATQGADIIELGVPFSDPMADGITIQHAFERALKHPFSMEHIISLVRKVRGRIDTPIILFGYYNPFYQYGLKKLCTDAQKAGVDGLLVVDLPPEEAQSLKQEASACGLDLIFLLAPTSTEDRIKRVAQIASGFIYYVSVTGVTGARDSLADMIDKNVSAIKFHTDLPVGVGFGISRPEHIRTMLPFVDAVIVGSAIIKIVEEHAGKPDLLESVGSFVKSLKEATITK